ncbi:serine hydroxymethyltransferase [Candidatus Woesearchaeota archaeon]|nr:serine hydroxymethyltransferase [Candidatus Woesearchaeota archaeon]|tara:strand:+ start:20229 stop:21560 length:1332 start_codon:yes stop_codon:yes gene_type:complete
MNKKKLQETDSEIKETLQNEEDRQEFGLEMIPSENFVSKAVMEAMGSVMTNKYSEGYPGKRYYGGNEFIDVAEKIAIERVKKLFKVAHVNVQPYSGSPANAEVYLALCKPGDTIMGQSLLDGGHLTHGWKTSFSGLFFNSIQYHVKADGYIDIEEARKLALEHKPKLIWIGASAYAREFPFKELAEIADEVGAYLVADIAHIAGLIVAGAHPSASEHVHIITTTTHKTLRGPRGAMIMVTEKGMQKDPDLGKKIDKAVFPGFQGGPHDHTTAAIAVAMKEADTPEFKEYAHQIVKNAKALAQELMDNGLKLVSGGTDTHLILVDLTTIQKGHGVFVQDALEVAGITTNKNTIPQDPSSPFYPSGIRLGTPALTTRNMKEEEMKQIGKWIAAVVKETENYKLPEEKEERKELLKNFRAEIKENAVLKGLREEVREMCKRFPLYK